ncbi:hypothetical protein V8E54_012677 [Elaphomyces granulatus]
MLPRLMGLFHRQLLSLRKSLLLILMLTRSLGFLPILPFIAPWDVANTGHLISDGCRAVTDQVRRSASVVDPPSICSRCLQPWDGTVSDRRTCDRCRITHRHTDIRQSIIPLVGTSGSDGGDALLTRLVEILLVLWNRSSLPGTRNKMGGAVVVYHGYRPVMISPSQLSRISRRFNNVFAFSTIDQIGPEIHSQLWAGQDKCDRSPCVS